MTYKLLSPLWNENKHRMVRIQKLTSAQQDYVSVVIRAFCESATGPKICFSGSDAPKYFIYCALRYIQLAKVPLDFRAWTTLHHEIVDMLLHSNGVFHFDTHAAENRVLPHSTIISCLITLGQFVYTNQVLEIRRIEEIPELAEASMKDVDTMGEETTSHPSTDKKYH